MVAALVAAEPSAIAIGTLNEGSLHAELKRAFSQPGDRFEERVGGFVIDIVRPGAAPDRRDELIEIQTGSIGALAKKLDTLLESHVVRVVHPVAVETRLIRDGMKPRRSPKQGSVYSVFDALVSLPTLVDHPHFTLDIALVEVDELRVPTRRSRRGWSTVDRRLRAIASVERFASIDDVRRLIPAGLPDPFTTADLAKAAGIRRPVAQKLAYCCKALALIVETGRTRAGIEYRMA